MQRVLLMLGGSMCYIVAVVHIARFAMSVQVLIDGWELPVWISLPAALVLIILSYLFFKAAEKKPVQIQIDRRKKATST